jgi:phosphohistidine phosphatase SixA
MKVLLVRHASAGDRDTWSGEDGLRPLDRRGHSQAEGIAGLLQPFAPTVILSSAAVRCRQTVEPLGEALGLEVENRHELAEGSSRDEVLRLAGALPHELAVFCTHGDVVEEVLGKESKKGSTWILRVEGDAVEPLQYLPRPG